MCPRLHASHPSIPTGQAPLYTIYIEVPLSYRLRPLLGGGAAAINQLFLSSQDIFTTTGIGYVTKSDGMSDCVLFALE
jgi:hypothetical protein